MSQNVKQRQMFHYTAAEMAVECSCGHILAIYKRFYCVVITRIADEIQSSKIENGKKQT